MGPFLGDQISDSPPRHPQILCEPFLFIEGQRYWNMILLYVITLHPAVLRVAQFVFVSGIKVEMRGVANEEKFVKMHDKCSTTCT